MMQIRRFPETSNRPYRRPNENGAPRFDSKPYVRGQTPKKFFRPPEIQITNDMQVTDGKHKGMQMKSTESPKVRPTARRVRELLFKILGRRVRFSRFLDLCAGSGAVGVEAVSRGSSLCTFVERSAKMCSFIKVNLHECKICPDGHGEICQYEALPYVKKMVTRKRVWDIVYFDPPYETDYDEFLEFFAKGACVRPDGGVLVIEHHEEMFFPEKLGCLTRRKVVKEGDTALTFYERGK